MCFEADLILNNQKRIINCLSAWQILVLYGTNRQKSQNDKEKYVYIFLNYFILQMTIKFSFDNKRKDRIFIFQQLSCFIGVILGIKEGWIIILVFPEN